MTIGASVAPASVFDGPSCVYLSPHHDDACFSLGSLIRRLPGGRLINLFTRSGYSITPPAGPAPDVDAITRRRIEEDNAFAAMCHLNKLDLGLTDAPLHGRRAMDLTYVHEDRTTLAGPLIARLRAIAAETPESERLTLFCPAGIGGHVNHVATMQTVIGAMPLLQQRYHVLFYEDLHYAADADRRQTGLLRLFASMSGRVGTRIAIDFNADAKAKLALVRLYQSQFESLPETCARYSPNVPDQQLGLHEAVWDFRIGATNLIIGTPQRSTLHVSTAGHAAGMPDRRASAAPASRRVTSTVESAETPPPAPAHRKEEPATVYGPSSSVDALLTGPKGQRRMIRLELNAVSRAAAAASAPLVSCVMLTANRPALARIAVACYRRQTWQRRQLVILDSGTDSTLEAWLETLSDPSINYKRVPRGRLSLGDLRNTASARARGDFISVWDDDDLHHPLRIETQMTALKSTNAVACLLSKLSIWWPSRAQISTSRQRPWEGTLVCKRDAMPSYRTVDKSEDTPAVTQLVAHERVVQIDAPELYVYVRHTANTWDDGHFERGMRLASGRYVDDAYDRLLARMMTAYPVGDYLEAIARVSSRAPHDNATLVPGLRFAKEGALERHDTAAPPVRSRQRAS